MRIAAAAYPLDMFDDWSAYAKKQRDWVAAAVAHGADLLVFPEYGAMELASLAGAKVAADLSGAIGAVSERVARSNDILSALAQEFGVYILGGSAPVRQGELIVNRAPFAPNGTVDHQDKQIMTRFEQEDWGVSAGGPLKLFDTELGKIGVLICYDCEFPLLARALIEAGAEVILVPSCTEELEGYWRVRIGAMARALEGQCATVMASLVGNRPEIFAVEENTGTGGIFTPPDTGFPPTGVLAEGQLNQPGWTFADLNVERLEHVRTDGHVLNLRHWCEQPSKAVAPHCVLMK